MGNGLRHSFLGSSWGNGSLETAPVESCFNRGTSESSRNTSPLFAGPIIEPMNDPEYKLEVEAQFSCSWVPKRALRFLIIKLQKNLHGLRATHEYENSFTIGAIFIPISHTA
jgi:hypothetical protein